MNSVNYWFYAFNLFRDSMLFNFTFEQNSSLLKKLLCFSNSLNC